MWNMESLAMLCVFAVTLLFHQVSTKPAGTKIDEVNNLEKELKLQKPIQAQTFHTKDSEDSTDWGDRINGINVGNVIRDVLITLRDHPEIVQKLIVDEERSLAEKVLSSEGTNVPMENINSFQQPSSQLLKSPKKVEKKNYNNASKRQKETPEETIDMTGLVEGGWHESLESDDTNPSNKETNPSIENPDKLREGGTQHNLGLKRSNGISDESESDSSSESKDEKMHSNENSSAENEKSMQKGAYWKNYGKQKEKSSRTWRMHKEKAKENRKSDSSENSNSEEENEEKHKFWQNYKNDLKESKDVVSKAQYWRNYGREKDNRKESSGDSKMNDSSNESNEDELVDLQQEKEGSSSESS